MDALLVDDSATKRMGKLLQAKADVAVTEYNDLAAALVEAQMRAFDFVLVDYSMPTMDGISFVRQLRAITHYEQVPIVMVTSEISDEDRLAAFEAGATDVLDKRMQGIELTVRLRNQIRLAKAVRRLAEQASWLDGEVEAALRHLHEREEEIIFRLSLAVDYRDNDTGDHTWRVAHYSQIIAEALDLSQAFIRSLYLAAPLHDIGKVAIPDGILLKPGRLEPEEFALVKTHATIGKRILSDSRSELIRLAAEIAEAHHEKWDGSGYPTYRLQLIGIIAALLVGLYLVLYRTSVGLVVRAGIENAGMVGILGIDVRRTFLFVFAVGIVAVGLAGMLYAPVVAVTPDMGASFMVQSFVVIVLGGLGSFPGAILGGLIAGEIISLTSAFDSAYSEVMLYGLMALVLVARPQGLFGTEGRV